MKEDTMNQNKPPKRESRAIWEPRYLHWRSSGLTKADFCKRHGFNPTTFYFWCAVFRKDPPSPTGAGESGQTATQAAFVPVRTRDEAPLLSLQCGDVTLSCAVVISAELLTQWVKALRSGVCSQ
jgi:transposase-like protein